MKVHEYSGNIIYIEDAIPMAKEFIQALEDNDNNQSIHSVIPEWEDWMDGHMIDGVWTPVDLKGSLKQIDWDYTINDNNMAWPRIEIGPNHDEAHTKAYEILRLVDEPFKKALEVWFKKAGDKELFFITKNYTIKKYNPGGYIDPHSDKDYDKDMNTFDWTALIYLNDDYTGGDVVFNDLGHTISPKAGSVLFFPSEEIHTANPVISGNKYFIFLLIQSKFGFVHGVYESFRHIVESIDPSLIPDFAAEDKP